TLVVAFDQADGAVDQSDAVPAEIRAHRRQERGQRRTRYVELGNHFAALLPVAELAIEFGVIIVNIDAEVAEIGPVPLTGGRQIIRRISFVGASRVRMRVTIEFAPLRLA